MKPPKENHFTNLVRDGVGPGAQEARSLARLVAQHADMLDDKACAGLMEFIEYARRNHRDACQWVNVMLAVDEGRGTSESVAKWLRENTQPQDAREMANQVLAQHAKGFSL